MRGAITGFLLVMSLALHARAEESFPGAIQKAANIPCTPTCILCHFGVPGTAANFGQRFGLAVLANRVIPGDPNSLTTVVANLRQKMTDTDGDGKIDVDELAAGTNPNDPNPNAELCGPAYGCGAHVASPPSPERAPIFGWLGGSLALAAFIAMRRRRGAAHRGQS